MKKDYIKPFVKVKVLDTQLCDFNIYSGAEPGNPADANAKEIFDFFE